MIQQVEIKILLATCIEEQKFVKLPDLNFVLLQIDDDQLNRSALHQSCYCKSININTQDQSHTVK